MPSSAADMSATETALLRGQLRLLQPIEGFRATVDTVLLAAETATLVKPGDRVLDVGCGVGSAGLCIALKKQNIILNGIDIFESNIDLAVRNAALNALSGRAEFVLGAIQDEKAIPDNSFDVVMSNPPYQSGGTHVPSPTPGKALAHGEDGSGITLEKWIKYMHRKVKQGGFITLVHRSDRLDEIIRVLTQRRWFGSLCVTPVHPHAGAPAKRVLITARRERYAPLVLNSGFVMHEADGSYTPAATAVLENLSPLRA